MKPKDQLKAVSDWINRQEHCKGETYKGWRMFSPADGIELKSLVKTIKEKGK